MEINPLIKNSVQKDYLPELPPWTFLGNLVDGGECQPTSKNLLISPHFSNIIILLNKSTSSAIKVLFLLHQIAIFISSPCTSFICSCSHCWRIIFFNFRLYMYTHVMLILINQCLLNIVLTLQKHWMVKFLPSNISTIPTFQCYLETSASLNACFPLFHTPFFISNLIKN